MLVEQSCRLPDVPHADCVWQVPPPPWQQTAGDVQSADDAQETDPPLDPELPLLLLELLLLELLPQTFG